MVDNNLSWPSYRLRNGDIFGLPPLWHFHRIMAGRGHNSEDNFVKTHVLAIEGIDWLCHDNGSKHKTSSYELVGQKKACIVRRGDIFNLALKCKDRAFDINKDRISLTFEFGGNPSVVKGTKAITEMLQRRDFSINDTWETLFDRRLGQRVEVMIRIPSTAPVGLWRLTVDTWQDGPTRYSHQRTFRTEEQFYILFNPFYESDMVYLSHPAGREEFVMTDVGKIYGGSHNNIQGRPWVFGQFRDSVLPAVCHLLDNVSKIKDSERADAVKVARAISAIVNSNDDNGVLHGRWDGNYSDGTAPFEWTGTVAILEEYMKNGGKAPVKYGQCWVFAAVTATICRALGLPCRCITNYVSAHDTDGSLTVDKFFDNDGETLGTGAHAARQDSVWNFHVWNEVWMRRPDLPDSSYAGWQVIDATPQEDSDNLMQCGPASVEAVRRGDLGLGFDVDFVFAEVNADIHTYLADSSLDIGFRISDTNTSQVGKLIITKAVGYMSDELETDYENVTETYKAREGSLNERLTYMKALRNANADIHKYHGMKSNDVFFQIIDLDKGIYGQPFLVSLFLHNQSREVRTVSITMITNSMFYTGSKAHQVKQGEGEFILQPYERETLTMTVQPDEYMPKTVEYCHFLNRFIVKVRQTDQLWTGEDNFILEKPKLDIRMLPDTPRVFRQSKIFIRFINPLDIELSKCSFSIEAPGIDTGRQRKIKFRNIKAREKVDFEADVTPLRAGQTTIVATFNANELYNVIGSRKISILG